MKLNGDRISPVKHLVLRNMSASREEDKVVVNDVVERVRHIWQLRISYILSIIKGTITQEHSFESVARDYP